MNREPNTQYVLSLSYGKDSIATLEAIRLLGYPLDRIIHAEIWATDTISADLPPMVEFKQYADRIIKERYGIQVEHICAMRDGEKLTYEKIFYHKPVRRPKRERERETGTILGFPQIRGIWCNSQLKLPPLQGFPSRQRRMVQETQNGRSGVEISTGSQDELCRSVNLDSKPESSTNTKGVFCNRRTGRDNKYGAVSRHCGRRARTNRPSYKARNRSSVSGHRVGRGVLPQVV